jgi:N-acetylneuraminic acid mutarotase
MKPAESTAAPSGTPAPTEPSTPRAATPGSWLPTGSTVRPHAWHVAVLLRDGRVLVAGGAINDRLDGQILASAERYDPQAASWTAVGDMAEARWGHSATLLPDGTVLVAGSYDNSAESLASSELFDPAGGTWTVTEAMNDGRGGHTATLLRDGTVVVAGGQGPAAPVALATAELYDPRSGRWTAVGSLNRPRHGHTATLLPDGRVLVVGGGGEIQLADGPAHSATAELYDPIDRRWTTTRSMTMARAGHTTTLLADGRVLVVGGGVGDETTARSAELYDPVKETWTLVSSMARFRTGHTATTLGDGRVLVAGGVGLGSDPPRLASAELFDPRTGTWTETASMITPGFGQTATLLHDGRVLALGDYDDESQGSAAIYDVGGG